jgi:hypothetical protein
MFYRKEKAYESFAASSCKEEMVSNKCPANA